MASSIIKNELILSLQVDGRGWNSELFQNSNKNDTYCDACGHICCDAVELGCAHHENDIYSYCSICLQLLISNNNGLCPINSHQKPIVIPIRSVRRKILTYIVSCPYSPIIQTKHDDQKQSTIKQQQNNDKCQWSGSLNDLVTKHIDKCAKNNKNASYSHKMRQKIEEQLLTINDLKKTNQELQNQNMLLKAINNEQKQKMNELIASQSKKINTGTPVTSYSPIKLGLTQNNDNITLNNSPCIDNVISSVSKIELVSNKPTNQSKEALLNNMITINDKLLFDRKPIKAWRYDSLHKKWRSRGNGRLKMYYNKTKDVATIIFSDDRNNNKTRLLQYIDGKKHCVLMNGEEVEWCGTDYTMDVNDPIVGKWKLKFINNAEAIKFFSLFNLCINIFNGTNQKQNKYDNNEPQNSQHDDNKESLFGALSNIGFNFDNIVLDQQQNENENNTNTGINFRQANVVSGHEDDELLQSFGILKLYRWGVDVLSQPGWKTRAANTTLNFYQNNQTGKIRIVARDCITAKLRLNQWISGPNALQLTSKSSRHIYWTGFDTTIQQEDDNNGYCGFLVKFETETAAANAMKMFKSSSVNNNIR